MTINQEHAKKMRILDENTASAGIDFAMKFLSRRYCKSMANWFGKAGMGMHVSCVIMKDVQRAVRNKIHYKKCCQVKTAKKKSLLLLLNKIKLAYSAL